MYGADEAVKHGTGATATDDQLKASLVQVHERGGGGGNTCGKRETSLEGLSSSKMQR